MPRTGPNSPTTLQRRLLAAVRELDAAGIHVVLSNSGVMYEPYTEAGFHVTREGATRSINSDATSRGEVEEVVATNVPDDERGARQPAAES